MNELGAAIVAFGATAILLPTTAALIATALPKSGRQDDAPPAAKPKARRAMASGTGRERGLIEKFNGPATPAASPVTHTLTVDPQDAFDSWFLAAFIIEDTPLASDVALWAEWTSHYKAYCAAHGFPLLGDREMVEAIRAYADTYACTFDNTTGDYHGGCIRK